MNRDRCKELLPVMTAFANGEEIEGNRLSGGEGWSGLDFVTFKADWEYRIKPNPREFTLETPRESMELSHGCMIAYPLNDEHNYRHADYMEDNIKVREVL